jgi:protein-tyrosine phosphatase
VKGFIDLHLHYVPGVDDGVKSIDEGLTLCRELKAVGYAQLVTTPHIRSGMFENRKPGLVAAFEAFAAVARARTDMPELALSAEHHCDGLFLDLFQQGALLPFPGGKALLVEFPNEMIPVAFEQIVFKLGLKGLRPIIAHPERYTPLFKRTDPVDGLLNQDVGLQLDLLSLVGKFGRTPRKAAERMLEEGAYLIAASDAHHPDDVPKVAKAIEELYKLVGDEEADTLLRENPRRLLTGEPTR